MRGCGRLTALLVWAAFACSDGHDRTPETGGDAAAAPDGGSAAGTAAIAGNAAAAGRSGESGASSATRDGGTTPIDTGVPATMDASSAIDSGADAAPPDLPPSGSFRVLTYNVAGLPEGLSSSMPSLFTPMIGPLLNGYPLVLLQESWQTPPPEENPFWPLRGYHEILVEASDHPYKTLPTTHPFGTDPSRPTALLGDGLNVFSRYPLGETTRVAWPTCVDTASDCLAFKGFSLTPAQLAEGVLLHIYDLHMEAGGSPADDEARALGIEQMIAFMDEHSKDAALLVGGDFNLHTESEPAASQFERLQMATGLVDACTLLACDEPGSIDKILVRSSDELELSVEAWESESDLFVSDTGGALSDHAPIAVDIAWSAR